MLFESKKLRQLTETTTVIASNIVNIDLVSFGFIHHIWYMVMPSIWFSDEGPFRLVQNVECL